MIASFKKVPSYIYASVIVFVVLLLLMQIPFIRGVILYIEMPFYDFAAKLKRKPNLHNDIAIVAITENTTTKTGMFPWKNHEIYKNFLRGLTLLKPKFVVWDIEFRPRKENDFNKDFREFAKLYKRVKSISAISLHNTVKDKELLCKPTEYIMFKKYFISGTMQYLLHSNAARLKEIEIRDLYKCLPIFARRVFKNCYTNNFIKYLSCATGRKLNISPIDKAFALILDDLYIHFYTLYNLSAISNISKKIQIDSKVNVTKYYSVDKLSQIIISKSLNIGFADVITGKYQIIRSISMSYKLRDSNLLPLSLVSYATYNGIDKVNIANDKITFYKDNIVFNEIFYNNNEMYVDFLKRIEQSEYKDEEALIKKYNVIDAKDLVNLGELYDKIYYNLTENYDTILSIEEQLFKTTQLKKILKLLKKYAPPGQIYKILKNYALSLKDEMTNLINTGGTLEEMDAYKQLRDLFATLVDDTIKFKNIAYTLFNRVYNKVIFVGGLQKDKDQKSVSISSTYPGLLLQVSAFNSLLNKTYIKKRFNEAAHYLIIALAISISYLILIKYGSIMCSIYIVLVITALFIWNVTLLNKRILYNYGQSVIFLFLPVATSIMVKERVEGRSRKMLKRTFQNFISKEVLNYLLAHPEKIKLGGEMKEATIFFSDLQGFTSFSEKYRPQYVIEVLNEYLKIITDNILDNKGFLDKYEGDGVMAAFGIPIEFPESAEYACKASCGIINGLNRAEQYWKERGFPVIKIRIGLSTGFIIAGNIGTEKRLDYTLIGDYVNLAARLEQANKYFGTSILIEENTYKKIKDKFLTRKIGIIKVKGKERLVSVYELIDEITTTNIDNNFIKLFNEAVEIYLKKNPVEAGYIFEKLYKINETDKVVKKYVEMCNELIHYESIKEEDLAIKLG